MKKSPEIDVKSTSPENLGTKSLRPISVKPSASLGKQSKTVQKKWRRSPLAKWIKNAKQ